jgi:DNA primase
MSEPVLDLLNKYELPFKVSGKDFVIKCLNPEHEDNNPSFRVDRLTGVAHCFSCGYKVNIFKHFGLLTNNNSIRVAKLKEKLKELYVNFNGVDFPFDRVPLNKSIRGISVQTLREFEAFYTQGREDLIDRAIFPIKDIRNRTVAYIGRHMLSNGNPRYLVYPSGAHLPVFPEQLKEKTKNLVLVEGIFDLLNLYDKGLKNVACGFGVNTLEKETALKLLPFRTQGISKIYLMFDGDEPGRNAMNKIKPLIEEADYLVEIIKLPEDTDPGDLSQEDVNGIKDWINENK